MPVKRAPARNGRANFNAMEKEIAGLKRQVSGQADELKALREENDRLVEQLAHANTALQAAVKRAETAEKDAVGRAADALNAVVANGSGPRPDEPRVMYEVAQDPVGREFANLAELNEARKQQDWYDSPTEGQEAWERRLDGQTQAEATE